MAAAAAGTTMTCPVFYLNILLLNKDELIKGKVEGKAGSGFLGRAAATLASSVVSDETVINSLAATLIEKVETAVSEMGISAAVTKVFQKGCFVTFTVTVQDIDKLSLILAAKGAEFAADFSTLLVMLTRLGLSETALPKIDEKISNLVHTKLMERFQEMIPLKMSEQGLVVECNCSTSAAQAEYFFGMLQRLEA